MKTFKRRLMGMAILFGLLALKPAEAKAWWSVGGTVSQWLVSRGGW